MDGLYSIYSYVLVICNIVGGTIISDCTNGLINMQCPTLAGCLLAINGSSFGHRPSSQLHMNCTQLGSDCMSNASFVWDLCHGQAQCTVRVPQERPTDKCKTVSSYLSIEFECVCVSCRRLLQVPFGVVRFSSTYLTAGTTALYKCKDGFPLVGPGTRTCQVDGRWTGVQPACSIPVAMCPTSVYSRSSYGAKCYEFVTRAATWHEAQNDCRSRNGSLSKPEGATEIAYIGWQLDAMGLYKYVWVDNGTVKDTTTIRPLPDDFSCMELHKAHVVGHEWLLGNTKCSYLNRYMCVYEIDQSWIADMSNIIPHKDRNTGLGLGIGVGIVLLFTCIFCIICREKKGEDEDASVHKDIPSPDYDFSPPDSDFDIYDDTTYDDTIPDDTPSIGLQVHKYSQVDKKRKHGQTDSEQETSHNYEEVYAEMGNHLPAKVNTYENVVLPQTFIGSLKNKFTLSQNGKQAAIFYVEQENVGDSNNGAISEPPDEAPRRKTVLRYKPQPAPKPAIRLSALEAKMKAIKASSAPSKAVATTTDTTTPEGGDSPTGPTPVLRWVRRRPGPPEEDQGGIDNKGMDIKSIHSGIDIVENELYDNDNHIGDLTEL